MSRCAQVGSVIAAHDMDVVHGHLTVRLDFGEYVFSGDRRWLEIAVDGTISIRPAGQDERTIAVVDRIKLVNPANESLYKGVDGLFRTRDGNPAPVDASIRLSAESLEMSNVSMVGSMVQMIELARRFEMDIKAMESAKQNDEAATRILSMS